MGITAEVRALHDLLMDSVPGLHPADCKVCLDTADTGAATVAELTQADVTAAVTKALADQQVQHDAALAELKGQIASKDTEQKVADLEAKLDLATAGQKLAEDALEAFKTEQAAEAKRLADAQAAEANKAARLKAVGDLEIFPEDHLAANADRWAAMDQATFDAALADYAALPKPAKVEAKDEVKDGDKVDPAVDHVDPTKTVLDNKTVTDAVTDSVDDAFSAVLNNRGQLAAGRIA